MKIPLRHSLAAAVAGAALSVGVNHGFQPPAARPNVLLITLDTFRADRIGAYGYKLAATPNLDRLAREGVRFADATTQSPLTGPAHTALLTGRYPTRFGVKNNASTPLPDSAVTLAEVLKESGYRTGAFIGAFVLERQYGFAQGFDLFDAAFTGYRAQNKQLVQRTADAVTAPAVGWMKASGDAPFFAWVHFYDAHTPYSAPGAIGVKLKARPYDGEIAYVDAAVGRLLASLSASGALDRTIVVAIGDHGEALGEHGEEEHGIFLYESVLRIPWLARLPNAERAGTVVTEQVRSIDLTPTLLDLVGIQRKHPFDGESVAAVMRGQPRRDPPSSYADAHYPQLHFGWSALRSLRVGEWKYVDAPKPELYDLRTDRAERQNVIAERSSVAARMSGELKTIERAFGPDADKPAPQPDPETLARLRSLGYVGIAAPTHSGTRGPDPKDRIQEFNRFKSLLVAATTEMAQRRPDAAIARLKQAAAINDRAYDLHIMLGDAWLQKRSYENALGEYEAAALLNPGTAAPHVLAAEVLLEQGRLNEAMKRLDAGAKIEPSSGEVALARGRAYERSGRWADALAEFQRAVAINPSDVPARGRLVGAAMNLKQFDVAEPHLRVLLNEKYQPARTYFALGFIAESRGNLAAAAAEYRRALAADPSLRQAADGLRRVARSPIKNPGDREAPGAKQLLAPSF